LSREKFLIKKEIVQLGTKCGALLEGRKQNARRVGEKDEKGERKCQKNERVEKEGKNK
jgi:hypothetical protein